MKSPSRSRITVLPLVSSPRSYHSSLARDSLIALPSEMESLRDEMSSFPESHATNEAVTDALATLVQNYEQEIGEDDIAFAENQYPTRRTQHKPKTTVPPTVWFPSETGCPDDNISQGTLTQFWKYFVDMYLFSKRAEGSSTPSS